MKLKLGVGTAHGITRDVAVSCDITTTVADLADTLRRTELFVGSNLDEFVALRKGHITLLGHSGDLNGEQLLDPTSPVATSGLQSGWQVTVVPEFGPQASRVIPMRGMVEVLNGPQEGATYSLVTGTNTIGRDISSRVLLDDRSVSRRHAVIEIDEQIVLRDLGSANGIEYLGERFGQLAISGVVELLLGTTRIRVSPVHTAQRGGGPFEHRYPHTRAPRIEPRFPTTQHELPKPPQQGQPSRIPMLAMLAPMLMGGMMFAVTGSPMSLMMVAFTPLMMIGSWVDNLSSARRKLRRELKQFRETLTGEREELAERRAEEISVRASESPDLASIVTTVLARGRLLWARRPEHRNFLELRFGDGTLPSRTTISLPDRGDAALEPWNALRGLRDEFARVAPVPVLERLDRCGSIGIAGDPQMAAGLARALVLQLTGLHSPAEVVVAAFAGSDRASGEWEWLKWLPHVDTVGSPIAAWQLADSPTATTRLLNALESLIEQRGDDRPRVLRSHFPPGDLPDSAEDTSNELPATPSVVVLVLEREIDESHRSRLIGLAEDGPDLGIHVIWAADDIARVPAACRSFVEVVAANPMMNVPTNSVETSAVSTAQTQIQAQAESQIGTASFVRFGRTVALNRIEHATVDEAAAIARALAPVDDTAARELDESDLPQNVHLRDLHRVDLLGGASPILQSWHTNGSMISDWRMGEQREAVKLAAVVGQGPAGSVEIDLRAHGPHALVGGTTGAGKSEFLQSWIMSLAANVSPDRVTYLLVDYKGGAAFAECVDLPHTVGLVTDLSPHLVRRALTSLRAELRYREELLAAHGAKDLIAMEKRGDPAAPPALVIVIDEFAALVSEVPDFVDGVIDVAQRGRSLGLHLILATQRPAGVIKDNLRANTNLRVALRMADEADSVDVIGAKDAAFFDVATPGRGAVKFGAARISHFQAGYLGGCSVEGVSPARPEIRDLKFAEGEAWDIQDDVSTRKQNPVRRSQHARDIERLRDGVIAAAESTGLASPRRPWLDTLPKRLYLDELNAKRTQGNRLTSLSSEPGVLVGLRDQPHLQRQEAVLINLDDAGNFAIYGASGTGKTSALLAFAVSTSAAAAETPVQIYAIDAAGGGLDPLLGLPTVGAVASLNDVELTHRVLRRLNETVRERGARFAAARANSLSAYCKATEISEPRVLLMIDGFSAFRQATETFGAKDAPMPLLTEIMQAGRAAGVHVVLTADRAGVLPSSLAASVQQQLVLRLASVNDYAYVDVPSDMLVEAPPGRGVFAGQGDEIQLALIGESAELNSQIRALESLGNRLRRQGVAVAPAIRNAPDFVAMDGLPAHVSGQAVFGIETERFTPVGMPTEGLGVISGPAGSGLSTAAMAVAVAITRWSESQGMSAERVLLTFAPDRAGGLGSRGGWDRIARGPHEVAELAAELTQAIGGALPSSRGLLSQRVIGAQLGGVIAAPAVNTDLVGAAEATASDTQVLKPSFPLRATKGVIVVERPTEAESTDALPVLIALAKAARRADVLVLFEFDQSAASGVWDLLSALKQPRWGLALQPDESDGGSPFRENFGRVKRADFPEGRGFAVEAGKVVPVQVATA